MAIITGGGTGIGCATAELLAEAGWNLALAGRRRAPLESAAAACRRRDPECDALLLPTDVTNADECCALVGAVDSHFARIDALINNAGGGSGEPVDQADPERVRFSMTLNALAPAWLIHFAWPIFQRQGGGCVVNVSSMAAHDPFPGLYAYAAAKAACESLIRSIRNERGDLPVRAFAVAPGAVETDLLRTFVDEATLPPELCMTPEAIAAVIVGCVLGRFDDRDGQSLLVPDADMIHTLMASR